MLIILIVIGAVVYISRDEIAKIDLAPFKKDFQLLGEWIIGKFKK